MLCRTTIREFPEAAYVIRGFFDPHAHTDVFYKPASFANRVVLSGTTTVFSDSHDLANSLGPSGFENMLKDFQNYPITFFTGVPAASPPLPEIEGKDSGKDIMRSNGGTVLVKDTIIVKSLPLPIGGIISPLSMSDLAREVTLLNDAFTDLGSKPEDPVVTLSFLNFTSILDLRITLSSLYRVQAGTIVF